MDRPISIEILEYDPDYGYTPIGRTFNLDESCIRIIVQHCQHDHQWKVWGFDKMGCKRVTQYDGELVREPHEVHIVG